MSTDKELLPCPFCGKSRAIDLWDRFDAGHIAHMHCEGCGADGPSIYSERGADDAIRSARIGWNTRAAAAIGRSMT